MKSSPPSSHSPDNKKPHPFSMRRGFCSPVHIFPCISIRHGIINVLNLHREPLCSLPVNDISFHRSISSGFSSRFFSSGLLSNGSFCLAASYFSPSLTNQSFCMIHATLLFPEGFVLPGGIKTSKGGHQRVKRSRPERSRSDKILLPDGRNIGKFLCYVNNFYPHDSSHRGKRRPACCRTVRE
jgi:hypothetical protein